MTQNGEPRSNGDPEIATNRGNATGSLREAFPGHFRPTAEEFARLWEDGMFVVDTSVLLNLYRYSRSTRDELLRVLLALEGKLFLPHQVGREFLARRLTTIHKQREGFGKLRERVTGVRVEMETELRKVLRLRPGEDLPEGLRDALEEVPAGGYEVLSERLEALENDLPRSSNSPDDDEVWAAIERLVDGKVGPAYPDEDMSKAEEEAERRRNANIPPGFKDQRPGDYVLWRQTIDEAKRSGRPVVLVTDDRKEDWWWIEQGETIGPRHELVAEMRREAGTSFYMYTPDRLMKEARERLGVEVSDESISEAEGLGRETDYDTMLEDWASLRLSAFSSFLAVVPVIAKTAAPDPAFVDSELTFYITLSNEGNCTAPGVTMSDILLPSMDLVAVTATAADGSDATHGVFRDPPTPTTPHGAVGCRVGDIPGGESASMRVVVIPRAPGKYTNHAGSSFAVPDGVTVDSGRNLTSMNITVLPSSPRVVAHY